jgi:hypothetical protein
MAKHQTTSSRALKAKTARKSGRKSKPKPRDLATEVLIEQRALFSCMGSLDKNKRNALAGGQKDQAAEYGELRSAVWHRSAVACDEFSFARVRTAPAAAYAIALAYSTLVTLDSIAARTSGCSLGRAFSVISKSVIPNFKTR